MTGQIVIKSSSTAFKRRQPLLIPKTLTSSPSASPPSKNSSSNVGEIAGVTAANCFIVCCCCPCIIVEFVILAVYKVPVTVFRRILKKRRLKKRKIKKERSGDCEVYEKSCYDDEFSTVDWNDDLNLIKVSLDGSAMDLDKKMWDQFHQTGFWRSSSQRNS